MKTCCFDPAALGRIRRLLALAPAAAMFLLASCASTPKGPSVGVVYPSASVEPVTVISRSEELRSATTGRIGGSVGSIAGSLGGGIAGSVLGGIGGIVGPAIESAVIKEKVSRYTLRQKDGQKTTIILDDAADPVPVGTTAYLMRHPESGTTTLATTRPATM